MLNGISNRLQGRAAALLLSLETRMDRIMQAWLLLAGLACAVRISSSPMLTRADAGTLLPYLLLIFGPFASMALALRWFQEGSRMPQPASRIAIVGRWRTVGLDEAQAHPLYGPGGLMVSLLVGILLNIPVRALEYLAAMPALAGPVPAWLATLHALMTLDVVLFSAFYTVAFVAALRGVPHFPRLLAAIWVGDLAMQLLIAGIVAGTPGLPAPVAGALHDVLDGNARKVLISVALWLPYLLLSQRVNVTYRHRLPA